MLNRWKRQGPIPLNMVYIYIYTTYCNVKQECRSTYPPKRLWNVSVCARCAFHLKGWMVKKRCPSMAKFGLRLNRLQQRLSLDIGALAGKHLRIGSKDELT